MLIKVFSIYILLRYIFWVTLFVPFLFASNKVTTDILYFFILLSIFIFFSSVILARHHLATENKKLDFFYILLITFITASWLYGVSIGLLKGNPVSGVFRNFFGLLFYSLFFALIYYQIKVVEIVKFLLFAFLIQFFWAVHFTYIRIESLFHVSILSLSDLRSAYSTAFILGFPVLTISLSFWYSKTKQFREFYNLPKHNFFYISIFLAASFVVVVPNASKGFVLAFILLFILFFILVLWKILATSRANFSSFILVFVGFLIFFSLWVNFSDIILYSFSSEEASNSVRSEQSAFILDEVTFWGAGLGAVLQSGYTRDATGYGLELTFLSLIHKLGFMSFFLFLSYAIPLLIALHSIVTNRNPPVGFLIVGCLLFMVPGAGNPILLSPIAIILHCFALYLSLIIVKNNTNSLKNL